MFIMSTANKVRKARKIWMKVRVRSFWANFVVIADEEQWYSTFRMEKETFLYLCFKLRKHPSPAHNQLPCREPLSVEEQIAIGIYHLAEGADFMVVGNVFGVAKSTVHKCVHRVCNGIVESLTPEWMKMPNELESEEISAGFEPMSHLPQILLAIDGSHIPITPPKNGQRDYFNRKGWASMVL